MHLFLRKRMYLLLAGIFFSYHSHAQYTRYVVQLKDKAGTPFSVNTPSAFLSLRAIERRAKQQIQVDETDLPVTPRYVDSIRQAGVVKIINVSRWFNQVCIETTDAAALDRISHFSFVQHTQPVKRLAKIGERLAGDFPDRFNETFAKAATVQKVTGNYYSYGNAYPQMHIHHGEYLHNKGYKGQGMLIAVIDAGFYHYLSLPAFDSMNIHQRVKDTYDFVNNETSVDEDHYHGMMCLSILAANIPGVLTGSGPEADFLLYRSEDASSEMPVEEQNWVAAAERADSAGADIITTSLGYNEFDDPDFDYTYADMNGRTTLIAQAAERAAARGMIVLAAAGNEGEKPWHYITTPADAYNILSVGAVNAEAQPAPFSSYGPASDGRIAPAVASVGWGTALSEINGEIVTGNGTSFATPNLAGLVACLWQAFPEFTGSEIIDAVKKSSSRYEDPDNRIGYGIPDFEKAFDYLTERKAEKEAGKRLDNKHMLFAYPNPFHSSFKAVIKPERSGKGYFALYDATGRCCLRKGVSLQPGQVQVISFTAGSLPPGVYFLKYFDGKNSQTCRMVMQ